MNQDPYVVVVWGDSIAAGGGDLSWPAVAERSLNLVTNAGRPVRVVNEGVCGKPASVARAEFEPRILPHGPDLVILQFGLNDLRHDGSRGALPVSTPDEFRHSLHEMARRCREEAGAGVCFFGNHRTLVPLTLPTGLTYEQARAQYNGIAASVARQLHAEFHDMSALIDAVQVPWTHVVSEDGVHLSPLGCHLYGRLAADIIGRHLARASAAPPAARLRAAKRLSGAVGGQGPDAEDVSPHRKGASPAACGT